MKRSKITIAIAENHALLRRTLQIALESIDFKVMLTSENGQILLEEIATMKELPQLCIIDINMPVLDGYGTARLLRLRYPLIKILGMTVFDNEEKRKELLAAGADHVIVKTEPLDEWERIIYYYCMSITT